MSRSRGKLGNRRLYGALAVAAVMIAGCGSDDKASTTTAAPTTDAETTATNAAAATTAAATTAPTGGSSEELKLLMSVPLTGDNAEIGKNMEKGAQLAAKAINDAGGIADGPHKGATLKIEAIDDQTSTEAATTIAAKFVQDKSYWAFTGFMTSAQAQAAAVVVEADKLPVFSAYAGADFLTTEADNIIVMSQPLGNYARAAVDYVVKKYGAKKIGVIAGDYSYLDSYYIGMDDWTNKLGVTWEKQIFTAGTVDFSPLLTNLENDGVDVILTGGLEGEAGQIIAQARQAGMKQPYVDLSGAGWQATYFKAAGDSAIGTIAQDAAPIIPEAGSVPDTIQKAFTAEFNEPMTTPSMYAYDTVIAIAAATAAGAENRKDLLTTVLKVKEDGTLGPIEFSPDLQKTVSTTMFTEVTGTTVSDRKAVAYYKLNNDLTVERTD